MTVCDEDFPCLIGKEPLFTSDSWKQKKDTDGYILHPLEKEYIEKEYDDYYLGDSSAIPFDVCPHCGASREMLEKFEEDFSQMTDGETAEYEAGTCGDVRCLKCGRWINYEM